MQYQVKDPQGNLHIIEGPEGATPDQVIAQAQTLIPKQPEQGILGATGEALKDQPSMMTDFLTNPVTQAKALPSLLGTAGAMSPIPGGATMGTVAGRQLSNAALRSYGKEDQIPSTSSQVLEGGAALLGDIIPIPLIKKAIFGKQIGAAEKAAGVVTRAAEKYPTQASLGEMLNNLEQQLDNGVINTPQLAKDAKEISDYVWNPKNELLLGKATGARVQAARISGKAQDVLNSLVENRAAPAAGMAKAMTIPNAIGKTYRAMPRPIRKGLEYIGPSVGVGAGVAEYLRGKYGR